MKFPVLQSWSCHNCAGCCRQHAIEITPEEKLRISSQGWTAGAGGGERIDLPLFVWHAGPPWKKRYRLNHQADGACVFLDERGLCKIHARFGEAAKPLACRIYPYAFHPAGRERTVSLRFSCPSVVANRGRPVVQNQKEIRILERLVVPPGADQIPAPALNSRHQKDWSVFLRYADALDASLADSSASLALRLIRALGWIALVEQADFSKLDAGRSIEFLEIVSAAMHDELAAPPALGPLSAGGMALFRMLVAQYARRDTAVELRQGWKGRFRLLKAAWKMARGAGNAPALQPGLPSVPFAAIEALDVPLPPAADELFTRYFRVKIQGLHFCGRAYYGVPLAEGFRSLAAMFPVVIWLARWHAVGKGRTQLVDEDVSAALAIADHHHGYSDALGQYPARARIRRLAASRDLERLILRYGADRPSGETGTHMRADP